MPASGSSKHGHHARDPSKQGNKVVEYFWYCCRCNYGPFNVNHYSSCTYCSNHNKGPCCQVEKIVRKQS
ncbi:hypothetical protein BU23DRAFT_558133 [Bimuria novae-zelandiae CBS 107.79]|uniref:Uncharacterized protein n=1 Tax=Bimuria novae-zelandiae CBS 107.79 TaxID=1447943 RepID=A0A6A5UYL6_9PLEO|nr:hypothetical protein BU23DRAFT_558133 [Bimuria novae-zelandiae CBS 107.79]